MIKMKREIYEIFAVANGWAVRPSTDVGETYVFTEWKELCEFLEHELAL